MDSMNFSEMFRELEFPVEVSGHKLHGIKMKRGVEAVRATCKCGAEMVIEDLEDIKGYGSMLSRKCI